MYRKILAAIDYDDEASFELIAKRSAFLARSCQAKISLVYVRMSIPDSYRRQLPWNWEADEAQRVKSQLRQLARDYELAEHLSNVHAPAGSIAREVIRTANEEAADVIVVAAHQMTLSRVILGSNAHAIMRDATCDLLVAKAG